MKRKVFAIAMALIMVFSTAVFAYAESEIEPYDTKYVTITANRTSRTTADVTVDVEFTQVVDSYSVVIYLQKKVDGEWVLDTTNDDYVFYNNGFNSDDFTFIHRYTSLNADTTYRIRCVSKDYINNVPHNRSAYSNPF